MNYAILKTGNKQYRVTPGDVIDVDRLFVEEGSSIELTDVLAVSRDGEVTVGTPQVADASVLAEVRAHAKDKKIIVFKYKRKVRYRRKKGHRQAYTRLSITSIVVGDEIIGIPERPDFAAPVAPEEPEPVVDEAPSAELDEEEVVVDEAPSAELDEEEVGEGSAADPEEADEEQDSVEVDVEPEEDRIEATLDTSEEAGQEPDQEEQTGGTT